MGFPYSTAGKESACNSSIPHSSMWETWVKSLGWEDPLEKGKTTTPVFWPGEFHGLYNPWGHKESNMTEQLSLSHIDEAY